MINDNTNIVQVWFNVKIDVDLIKKKHEIILKYAVYNNDKNYFQILFDHDIQINFKIFDFNSKVLYHQQNLNKQILLNLFSNQCQY